MDGKILFLILFGILVLSVCPFGHVLAANLGNYATNQNIDITTIFSDIVDLVWMIAAAIAVILFIFAGIMFLTSAGEPEKLKTARAATLWGVIGVAVMILAFSIHLIVSNVITAT